MKAIAAALLCLGVSATINAAGQQPGTAGRLSMVDVMSAKEFDAAGLKKLSPEELKALDAWLNSYMQRLVGTLLRSTSAEVTPGATATVVESQIDGSFSGWEGETVFKLRNGQIWQQSSYAYTYHYAYAPSVLIYKGGSGYKMKVDGVSSEISVRRLK